MTKEQFITIGIPVYNGRQYMASTLESVMVALKNINDSASIEVLVSDNKSTDNTKEIVDNFKSDDFNIRYICNEVNVGYDANLDNIAKNANGHYIWFLGCGEVIKSDSLLRLLEKIDGNTDYTNVLLDFDIFSESENKITDLRVFDFDDDVLLSGKNNFQRERYAQALSSNIINKREWLKVVDVPLVVDGWCHIEKILNMISIDNDSKTLILPHPYFTLYREVGGWWESSNSYKLLLLHIRVIDSMVFMGYEKKVVSKLRYKLSRLALVSALIQSKGYGLKVNKNTLKELFEMFYNDVFLWSVVYPVFFLHPKILFIPKKTIQMLRFLKKSLKNV